MVRDDLRAGDEVCEIRCRCGGSCYCDTLRHDGVARCWTFYPEQMRPLHCPVEQCDEGEGGGIP